MIRPWTGCVIKFNDAELERILQELAKKVGEGHSTVYMMDSNGNSCGHATFK